MPHDKTRLWTGLMAITAAATVLGTLYTRSAFPTVSQGNPDAVSGRIALAGYRHELSSASQDALRRRVRDYQSEVTAALAHQSTNPTAPPDESDGVEDDVFDVDPLDGIGSSPYGNPPPGEIPNPTDFATLGNPNPVAYSTDGPIAGPPPNDNPNGQTLVADQVNTATRSNSNDDYGQSGTVSDSDVYRLVVTNLSDEQRQDFTRAYASMTSEQRAELLDGFRQQIQGGQ